MYFLLFAFVLQALATEDGRCAPGGLCEQNGCASDLCCACAQCSCDGSHVTVEEPLAFSWSQCGGSGATLGALSITPDPVVLGKNITAKATWAIKQAGTSSSMKSVTLHLDKKVLGVWVEIPCVGDVGSCTYQDPCTMLEQVKDQVCPILQPLGIPCSCPIAVGTYSLGPKGISALVKNPNLSWLTNGDFYAKVTVDNGSDNYFCLEVYVSVVSSK